MLEHILSPANLNRAYKRVRSNKGSGGVDKMEVESLGDYIVIHKDELIADILNGKFKPNPVLRVEIPKEGGKKRKLGIPTVVVRVVQQAIAQVLSPVYERQFSPYSYGFRPNRNQHQALNQFKDIITDGYKYAVDMDLEKFFDIVNQNKLIEVLSRTVKDGRVISLIHKYLNAGVVVRHKFGTTDVGVLQGGPLSPLLSNVMLNELDKELEIREHRFVRYADVLHFFCKSKRSAERTLRATTRFIENKLFLKVNKEKTAVAYISKIKFSVYSF
jgi:group II intron reverse transcriptase/maturase